MSCHIINFVEITQFIKALFFRYNIKINIKGFLLHMENIKDIIYGLAIGDALGVPIEFQTREYLKKNKVNKMLAYGTHNQPKGTWSDDTSLTLCLLDAIDYNQDIIDEQRIKENMINWYNKSYFTATNNRFDIGFTTALAIENIQKGYPLYTCGPANLNSNGNGALMRISPLVNLLKDKPIEERYPIIKNITSITHGHEINILGCCFYIELMINILNNRNKDKFDILNETIKEFIKFYEKTDLKEFLNLYKRILDKEIFIKNKSKYDISIINSSGYIIDSLEASIFCFVTENSYKKAVIKAINLGKDTDTIGAITGSMSALYYGFNNIPKIWIKSLKNKELINLILKSKL